MIGVLLEGLGLVFRLSFVGGCLGGFRDWILGSPVEGWVSE